MPGVLVAQWEEELGRHECDRLFCNFFCLAWDHGVTRAHAHWKRGEKTRQGKPETEEGEQPRGSCLTLPMKKQQSKLWQPSANDNEVGWMKVRSRLSWIIVSGSSIARGQDGTWEKDRTEKKIHGGCFCLVGVVLPAQHSPGSDKRWVRDAGHWQRRVPCCMQTRG